MTTPRDRKAGIEKREKIIDEYYELFKMGVNRERVIKELLQKGAKLQKEEILSEEFKNELWRQSKPASEFPKSWTVIPTLDVIKELGQRINQLGET